MIFFQSVLIYTITFPKYTHMAVILTTYC